MDDRRRLVLAFGLALGLAGVLAGYYAVHKPVTPAQAAHLGGLALEAGAALWLTWLGGGLGRRLLGSGALAEAEPGERVAVQAGVGWGALALAGLGLGALSLLHIWWVAGLLAALTALTARDLAGWGRDLWAAARALWRPGWLARGCALLVGFALTLGLLRALAPPVMWDALVYHLTLPQWYAELGHWRVDPTFMFTGMPQLNEMLFALAYLLRGAVAAQVLGWAFGLVLALGLAGYAAAQLGAEAAAPAAAILFSAYTLAAALAWAYAELLLMLLALGVLIALRLWGRTGSHRWLAWAGALAGGAMGCKYTGVIVPLAAAALVAGSGLARREPARRWLAAGLTFGLAAGAAFAPWLIKNLWLTGNPVYPLLWPTPWMDAWRLNFYNRPDLIERNPLAAALIFFRTVFLGVQGGNDYDATLGPLWVLLPGLLAAGWRWLPAERRARLGPIVGFCLAAYLGWVGLMFFSKYAIQARLFFGIFPALAVLAVAGLQALPVFDTPRLRFGFIARAMVALTLALGAAEQALAFAARSPLAYLAGEQTAAAYREAQLGWYAVAMDQVNALPEGARVVFLWEPRGLGCAVARCVPDEIIDRWYHLRRTVGAAEAILQNWQAAGVTHVLVADWGAEFVRTRRADSLEAPADWEALADLRARLTPLAQMGGAYTLYALP